MKAWSMRMAAVGLGIAMLLADVPSVTFAKTAEDGDMQQQRTQSWLCEEGETTEHYVVNPLYEDVFSLEELKASILELTAEEPQEFTASSSEIYRSIDAAAEYVRTEMMERETTVTVTIDRQLMVDGFYKDIINRAMEVDETTPSAAGDCLAFEYGGYSVRYSSSGTITYTLSWYADAQQEKAAADKIRTVVTSLNLEGKTDYEKVRAIHDYICANVTYDYTNLNNDSYKLKYTSYAAICNGTAVCQGYAVLFYRMCVETGLSVRVISGRSSNQGHAWNIVRIGKPYYNIDCTWDSGRDKTVYYGYFLKNEKDFKDHTRNEQYVAEDFVGKYPMGTDSWIENVMVDESLEMANLASVSFETIDGRNVTNQAQGKNKILIFYSNNSDYSKNLIRNLSEDIALFENTDILAIEAKGFSREDVASFAGEYGCSGISFCYSVSDLNRNQMWEYARKTGVATTTLYFPVIVYIDKNNKIQFADMGKAPTAEEVLTGIRLLCDKTLTREIRLDGKEQIPAGASVGALVYEADKELNPQFYTWESSDPSVAVVNGNGVITGILEGAVTIYCKVGTQPFAQRTFSVTAADGWVEKDGVRFYYVNGVPVTGLYRIDGVLHCFDSRGAFKSTLNGFVKHTDGLTYYLKGGMVQNTATGLFKHTNGKYYYVKDGVLQSAKNGLVKHTNGNYYYVKNGALQSEFTGFVKHTNGNTYYVENGKLQSGFNGFVRHTNGKSYYVKKGMLELKATGLFKHTNGKYYYAKNGVLQSSFEGIVEHTNGLSYYIKGGKMQNGYTGKVTIKGVEYTIVKGIVQENK